jgi:hypothetical protein
MPKIKSSGEKLFTFCVFINFRFLFILRGKTGSYRIRPAANKTTGGNTHGAYTRINRAIRRRFGNSEG